MFVYNSMGLRYSCLTILPKASLSRESLHICMQDAVLPRRKKKGSRDRYTNSLYYYGRLDIGKELIAVT